MTLRLQHWAVWATPPSKGIFTDLPARFQMWVTGEPVVYTNKEEAEAYAATCRTDRNGWTYEVKEFCVFDESDLKLTIPTVQVKLT